MPKTSVYSREMIYRFLYDNTDENNNVGMSQGMAAQLLGIGQYHFSRVMSELQAVGLVEKNGHKFTLLYHPDKLPWDKYEILRRKYSEHKAQQQNGEKHE